MNHVSDNDFMKNRLESTRYWTVLHIVDIGSLLTR